MQGARRDANPGTCSSQVLQVLQQTPVDGGCHQMLMALTDLQRFLDRRHRPATRPALSQKYQIIISIWIQWIDQNYQIVRYVDSLEQSCR